MHPVGGRSRRSRKISRSEAIGVTKRDLIDELAGRYSRFSRREVEVMVNTVIESLVAALRRGERIEIRGFGSFIVKQRQARDGRNPRTGRRVAVAAKRVPFFKVGKDLRQRVNGEKSGTAPARRREASQSSSTERAPAPKGPAHGDPGMTEDVI